MRISRGDAPVSMRKTINIFLNTIYRPMPPHSPPDYDELIGQLPKVSCSSQIGAFCVALHIPVERELGPQKLYFTPPRSTKQNTPRVFLNEDHSFTKPRHTSMNIFPSLHFLLSLATCVLATLSICFLNQP